MPGGQPDLIVKIVSSTLLKTGLDSLKPRFGTPHDGRPRTRNERPARDRRPHRGRQPAQHARPVMERFWQAPLRAGIAEGLIEQEQLNAQFLGDLDAYDRLEQLAGHLLRLDPGAARTALIEAQVAASALPLRHGLGLLPDRHAVGRTGAAAPAQACCPLVCPGRGPPALGVDAPTRNGAAPGAEPGPFNRRTQTMTLTPCPASAVSPAAWRSIRTSPSAWVGVDAGPLKPARTWL
jgi:hypothetical protein